MECLFKAAWIVIVIYDLQAGFLCWDAFSWVARKRNQRVDRAYFYIYLHVLRMNFNDVSSFATLMSDSGSKRQAGAVSTCFHASVGINLHLILAPLPWGNELVIFRRGLWKLWNLEEKKKTWLDLRTEVREINNKRCGAGLSHFFFLIQVSLMFVFFLPAVLHASPGLFSFFFPQVN